MTTNTAARAAATRKDETAALDYVLDAQVGFVLRQVQQRHTTIFASLMIDNLTPTQWAALSKLAETGPCSQNQLGRLTAMDVATIKGVIDRLTARGLTETSPDPDDGRRLLVSLSRAGHQLAVERERPLAVAGGYRLPSWPDPKAGRQLEHNGRSGSLHGKTVSCGQHLAT